MRAGVLATLLFGAGAGSAGDQHDDAPRLVFSHEKHFLGLDQDCVSCHLPESGHRVPGMDVCAHCHDATESEAESDCRICHVAADLSTLEAGDSLRRGIGFRPKLWRCVTAKYDHGLHAKEAACTVCHPLAPASTSAEDVLYPSVRTFRCMVCHSSDPCVDLGPEGIVEARMSPTGTGDSGDGQELRE